MSDALKDIAKIAERIASAPIKQDWSAADDRNFDFVQIALRVPDRDMLVAALAGQWQPMATAPKGDYHYIAVRRKTEHPEIMIVSWTDQYDGKSGWWLPEGYLFQDSDLIGWSPVPQS